MKNKKNIIKIFSLVALFAFSTSFVFAQVQYTEQLSDRLKAIIQTYGDGENKKAVNKAQKMYVYKGSKAANAEVIKGVQEYLVKKEYLDKVKSNGKSSVDGSYGNLTRKAIMKFQKENNLSQDGIIGPKTAAALKVAISQNQSVASIPEKVRSEVESVGAIAPVNNSEGIQNSPLSRDTSLGVAGPGGNDYFGGDVSMDGLSDNSSGIDSDTERATSNSGRTLTQEDLNTPKSGWDNLVNGIKSFPDKVASSFNSLKEKILGGITTTEFPNSTGDSTSNFATKSALKRDSVNDYISDLSKSGVDQNFVDKVQAKIAESCGSSSGDTGCFDAAVLETAKENPGTFYKNEIAANKFLNDKELQNAQDLLDGNKKDLAELSGDAGPTQTASIEPEPGDSTGSGGDKENEDVAKQSGKITRKGVFSCECDEKGKNCKEISKTTFLEVKSLMDGNSRKFFTPNAIAAKEGDDYVIEKQKLNDIGKKGTYYSRCPAADENDVKEKKADRVGQLIGKDQFEPYTEKDQAAQLVDTNTTAATEAATGALPAATAE